MKRYWVLGAAFLALLAAITFFFPNNIERIWLIYGLDPCQPHKNYYFDHYQETYNCYYDKTSKIVYNEGTQAGLEYMEQVVSPKTNFGLSHIIMHEVGHEAWHSTESLDIALARAPDVETLEEYWKVDGFVHGVFHGYFEHEYNETPIADMVKGCSDYPMEIQNSQLHPVEKLKALDCFHAMGHGMMSRNGNKVGKSIKDCDLIQGDDARHMCYYGAFMENAYLYLPFYFPEAPRPDVKGAHSLHVCANYTADKLRWCALFPAWSLVLQGSQVEDAFKICGSFLDIEARKACIQLPSKHMLPRQKKGDYEQILDTCLALSDELEGTCIQWASNGIRQGVAGYGKNIREFCAIVPRQYQGTCLNTHPYLESNLATN